MSEITNVLCLSLKPSLREFDQPLCQQIAQQGFSIDRIDHWNYYQSPDQASSFETALEALHSCILRTQSAPIHLIGHGTSGLLGLLYAQRYPEQVRSLTLLSVGIYPTQDWQSHYYRHRRSLSCSRQQLLERIVDDLFGTTPTSIAQALVTILENDLDHSLSPHSLIHQMNLLPIVPPVPMLVCGSVDDVMVSPYHLHQWQNYLDRADLNSRMWICSGGRYFFHYFYAEETAKAILDFWASFAQFTSADLRTRSQQPKATSLSII